MPGTHACLHMCTHNRKLPPISDEFMQIAKMQIRVGSKAQLASDPFWGKHNKKRETQNESITFNLDRQKDSLIRNLTSFPRQCPASSYLPILPPTPFMHPMPSGPKPQVQPNANHWVENARWQHSGVFAIGQWTMREFPEPLVVLMEQLDTNTRHRSGWEETMQNNREVKT